jgi:hypothetical protein
MIIYAQFIRIFSFYSVGIINTFVSLEDATQWLAPGTASLRLRHFYILPLFYDPEN